MPLIELNTSGFRSLIAEKIQLDPHVNVICGANGSGKSSVLEAIYTLSSGRSFRTTRREHMVQHGQSAFTVFGVVMDEQRGLHTRLGLQWDSRERQVSLRKDGERVSHVSEFASVFPCLVIDPDTFELVAGAPGRRRQYLDWLVFHVEHDYARVWRDFQRVLSQRNQLLRSGRIDGSLKVWNQQYVGLAEQVTQLRQRSLEQVLPMLQQLIGEGRMDWLQADDLRLDFYPGWDAQRTLAEVLEAGLQQELRQGFTLYGPGRADLRIRYRGRAAAEVLSRGQQKTLVILLRLAQGMLISRTIAGQTKSVTFLLDDINAELDEQNRYYLVERLRLLGVQVVVTSIERQGMDALWRSAETAPRMFHVEHGRIIEE